MAQPTAEARIRDLERRLDMDPGSRLFVALAEEYRKAGRVKDALSALQKGLLAHPGYVAAQVALGRAYLEAHLTTDAIATFTKVLVADPGNLVAAKSLADVYLGRGDSLEALKKYKLYRAISSDRKVDEVIARLETVVAPKPVTPPKTVIAVEPPPPPPSFQETDKSRRRSLPKVPTSGESGPVLSDPFDITSVSLELGEDSGKTKMEEPFPVTPTRDVPLAPPPAVADVPPPDAVTRVISIADAKSLFSAPHPEDAGPIAPSPPRATPAAPIVPPSAPSEEPGKPTGRALADLYYAQGHYAEALQIYDDLVMRHPFDDELQRMRRDAEARLLPAGTSPAATREDSLDLRLAKIRALKEWLSLVQAG